ncbi:MAG: dTMP kinase [Pyrinomonadaceae bacterium]
MGGLFVTFEGVDGSGKSTQLEMLAAELRRRGQVVLSTREPGGTPLGIRLRESLLDINEQVDPLAELLIFAADRAQHVRTVIQPALAKAKTVLSDRYADATVAYQGAGRGFPRETIDQVIALATGGLKPDLTLFFDLPVEEGLHRISARAADGGHSDRIDVESHAFHQAVRDGYLAIARAEPERFRVIDAMGTAGEIHARVLKIVSGKQ